MGAAIARVLGSPSVRVVATLAGRSARTNRLAVGLDLLPTLDDVVRLSDIVLSVVPPGAAPAVADAIASSAQRCAVRPIVADLNATAPETMAVIATRLGAAGLEVVDGSISGGPPRPDAGPTIVYLSGLAAPKIASLAAPGLDLRVVGDTIGIASAIKMSTASFYKGQAALFAQALRAAHANGVLGPVLDDLQRNAPELVDEAPLVLQSIAAKSGRYVPEMLEIAASQGAVGLSPALFNALAEVYERLSQSELAAAAPEDADSGFPLEGLLARMVGQADSDTT